MGMKRVPQASESAIEPDVPEQPECQHHWVIAKPSGPVSRGKCRVCGEEKDFQNFMENAPWSRAKGKRPAKDTNRTDEESAVEEDG